jgi:hypothetical protein
MRALVCIIMYYEVDREGAVVLLLGLTAGEERGQG